MMMLMPVGVSLQVDQVEKVLISVTESYIVGPGSIKMVHHVKSEFFKNGSEVEDMYFQKYVMEHDKDELISIIDMIKEIQKQKGRTNVGPGKRI
jgi:hypothetical protein